MNSGRDNRSRQAFTLIELLVVVAIFSVLLAVLLPALHGARMLAGRARCAGQLRSIAVAWITYVEDNQGRFLLKGVGANPEYEFGGWPGDPQYGYATRRPLNPYVGLDANSPSENEARLFRCPADAGDVNYPTSFFKKQGNSYRANTALGCSGGIPQAINEPWHMIHKAINDRLKGLVCANVPGSTLLVGDYNWLTQIDPLWTIACAKSWHGPRHYYNVGFMDSHVGHVRIRKGIYFEQGVYRWQPFKAIDEQVLGLQKPVPCHCGLE
jgi:prepilin-type N-terminal cleavage/methylation domain-containing protein